MAVKLVDQIGGEDEAIAWLKDVKKVDKDAKVVDWKPESTPARSACGRWLAMPRRTARAAGRSIGGCTAARPLDFNTWP